MTGIGSGRARGWLMCAVFMAAQASGAVETVSSNGADKLMPPANAGSAYPDPFLPDTNHGGDRTYVPLDVSTDGRYVLFSNYMPPVSQGAYPVRDKCKIFRKDLRTGALIAVFKSVADARYYCNGARMSDDGNIVVTPPAAPPEKPSPDIVQIDGIGYLDYGNVVELAVRDINSGTTTEIERRLLSRAAGFIQVGNLELWAGSAMHSLSGNGAVALTARLTVTGNSVTPEYFLVDIGAGTVETDHLAGAAFGDADFVTLTGIAISDDGNKLAVSASVATPLQGGRFPTGPGDGGDCLSFWCSLQGQSGAAPGHYFFSVNRRMGNMRMLEELFEPGAPVLDAPFVRPNPWRLHENSLGAKPNVLTLLKGPERCFGFPGAAYACGPTGEPCVGKECELRIGRYKISTGELKKYRTRVRDDSLPDLSSNRVSISADGTKILYPRRVRYPFGGDWEVPENIGFPTAYTCVSRESIDSMSGVPVIEECLPTNPGPISDGRPLFPGDLGHTELQAPLLWFLRDLNTNTGMLVSITDKNALFQSTTAVLSGDGDRVAFQSRDPRLRPQLADRASLGEAQLPAECFWTPDGMSGNLRSVTNDNVRFFSADTQYIYEEMPVFCPAPSPAIDGQVFAVQVSGQANALGGILGRSDFAQLLRRLFGLPIYGP